MPRFILNWGGDEAVAQYFAVALLVLVSLATVLCIIIGCFCGRENEYTEIRDIEFDGLEGAGEELMENGHSVPNGEVPSDSLSSGYLYQSPAKSEGPSPSEKARATSPAKKSYLLPKTSPTLTDLTAADKLVQEIDYYVRHMDDFYATGFYCSVVVLENQLNLSEKWRIKSLREFIRKDQNFKMRSNMSAFKLVNLTPFRERDVQVAGCYQCVNVMCRHYWQSVCSFSDHFQKCPLCLSRVYPFEQNPLTPEEASWCSVVRFVLLVLRVLCRF